MGAVRMRVQTADRKYTNNPQVIHNTQFYQLTFEVKSCMFVRNKTIIKISINFKLLLLTLSSIHDSGFSIEKVVSSESGEKYAFKAFISF